MSGDLTSNPLLAVYLLHFLDHKREPHHYVGITSHDRLDARMREHQAGRGSRVTAAVAARGAAFDLAKIFTTYNPALETSLIALGLKLRVICPVCRGEPPLQTYRPTKRAAGMLPPLEVERTAFTLHAWPRRPCPTKQKRDRSRTATPLP